MSRKRDWDRLRHERQSAPSATAIYDGPVLVDPQEPLIQEILAAKRAGRNFRMPTHLKEADRRRVWRAVFIRLGNDKLTGGQSS